MRGGHYFGRALRREKSLTKRGLFNDIAVDFLYLQTERLAGLIADSRNSRQLTYSWAGHL